MRDITAERPVQRKSIGLEGADASARFAIKYILDGPSRPVEMAPFSGNRPDRFRAERSHVSWQKNKKYIYKNLK